MSRTTTIPLLGTEKVSLRGARWRSFFRVPLVFICLTVASSKWGPTVMLATTRTECPWMWNGWSWFLSAPPEIKIGRSFNFCFAAKFSSPCEFCFSVLQVKYERWFRPLMPIFRNRSYFEKKLDSCWFKANCVTKNGRSYELSFAL